MDSLHLHLMLVHVPVVGFFFAALSLAAALFSTARGEKNLGRWALFLAVISSLSAVPAVLTGERAEDRASRLPDISMDAMDAHEEAAEKAALVGYAAGAAALVGLGFSLRRDRGLRASVAAALILSMAALGAMGWAAFKGGEIRHTEIRPGAPAL
jgi:uncharacterized membrane protein